MTKVFCIRYPLMLSHIKVKLIKKTLTSSMAFIVLYEKL